jgi:hypothetical protein
LSGNINRLPELDSADVLGHITFTGTLTEFPAITVDDEKQRVGAEFVEVILPCQIGPIPGTFPTLRLFRRPENPRHYFRMMAAGVVSQISLYSHDRILSHRGISPNQIWAQQRNEPNVPNFLGMTIRPAGSKGENGPPIIIRAGKFERAPVTASAEAPALHAVNDCY